MAQTVAAAGSDRPQLSNVRPQEPVDQDALFEEEVELVYCDYDHDNLVTSRAIGAAFRVGRAAVVSSLMCEQKRFRAKGSTIQHTASTALDLLVGVEQWNLARGR